MLTAVERRREKRIPYKHVIRYSYPALNSSRHLRAYTIAKRISSSSPLMEAIFNRVVASGIAEGLVSPKKTWATTDDVSPNGLCLILPQGLDVGQDVLLFDGRLSHRAIPARIRWCTPMSDRMYKVGLMYSNLSIFARSQANGSLRESYQN